MALDGSLSAEDLIALTSRRGARGRGIITLEQLQALRAASPVVVGRSTRKPQAVRLLGIDPGTRYLGWGVIERGADRTLRLIACGCIAPGNKLALKNRLCAIFAELETIIRRTKPQAAALEETFAGVNMKSAIAMGEGRGVALLALARAQLEVLEISPRSIKQAVTGSGAASKAQVAAMVAAHLTLKQAPKPEDVTDALAAAIALAQRH